MQAYLNKLEKWFNAWRLQISTHKSFFKYLFQSQITSSCKRKKINDSDLSLDQTPTYLRARLDSHMNFNHHADRTRNNCLKGLSVLANLSYKNTFNL